MRLTPWLLSIVLGSLLLAAGPTLAEETESDATQAEALDDVALEKKYGIKAGALQRDESASSGAKAGSSSIESDEEDNAEGGTGGTGSADDATVQGEDEQSSHDSEQH